MSTTPKILVAIDLATRPSGICRAAADLARRVGAEVTLLNVVGLPSNVPPEAMVQVGGDSERKPAGALLHADATARLRPHVEYFAELGVPVDVSVRSGPVASTIVACAEELDALFVVAGTDVPSGLKRLVTEGFTASILKASTRPVLVVPPSGDEGLRGRSAAQTQVDSEADG